MTETKVKERGILFSADMVRAILEDRKSQTRRVITHPGSGFQSKYYTHESGAKWCGHSTDPTKPQFVNFSQPITCPFGKPGDQLYVRETWAVGTRADPRYGWRDGIEYRADEADLDEHDLLPLYSVDVPDEVCLADLESDGWRPSIHMPRWASRIQLEVTGVRVERVQDITPEDIIAEGLTTNLREHEAAIHLGQQFERLWNDINADRGYSWESNPFVWVIDFRRIK